MKTLITTMLFTLTIWCQGQETRAVNAANGHVEASGKFVPKGVVKEVAETKEPVVKKLGEGKYSVDSIVIDSVAKTVRMPVEVNLREGVLEYLLVHENGKVHESLLATKVNPRALHIAVLLLGVEGKKPRLELTWRKNGPDARVFLSKLISSSEGAVKITPEVWVYGGSFKDQYGFAAEREGSIISLIHDTGALIRHSGEREVSQEMTYTPVSKLLPREGVPQFLEITFN